MNSKLVCASIVLLGTATSLHAETQCHTFPIPLALTNWSTTVAVPRFDPALGLLREVRISFSGRIEGSLGYENLSPTQQSLTGYIAAELRVLDPAFAVLASLNLASPPQPFDLAAFDGIIDFAGTSGATITGLSATNMVTVAMPYPSGPAALFVGPPYHPGTVLTPISAQGASTFAGNNGNEVAFFTLQAGGTFDVCYVYDLDCNANAVADDQDITSGTSPDANGNGVPDECDYSFAPGLCTGDGTGLPCPCGNTSAPGSGAGCANSAGSGGLLVASGVARVSADSLLLAANGMPASTSTLFFQGTSSVNSGLGVPLGDGLRCASGTLLRLGTRPAQAGAASFPPPGGPGVAVTGAVTPGLRVYQVWYRNAASFCTSATFNLTNGVGVVWGV